MAIDVKKIRVMWNEQLELNNNEDINFLCSFDGGDTWISFHDVLTDIRSPIINGRKVPFASYTSIDNETSAIDFTIPLTFNSVPAISAKNTKIIPYPEESTEGFPAGEYYIKVAGISSSFVGMNESDDMLAATSAYSKAFKVNIPARGDIELGVQFPSNDRGLAVYIGKKTSINLSATIGVDETSTVIFTNYIVDGYTNGEMPVEYGTIIGNNFISSIAENGLSGTYTDEIATSDIISLVLNDSNRIVLSFKDSITLHRGEEINLKLNVYHYRLAFISNLTTELLEPIEANSSNSIKVSPKYPLPYSGRIRVDSENITYTDLSFQSDATYPAGYYLIGGEGNEIMRSTPTATHNKNSVVYSSFFENGGIYGEVPNKKIAVYQNPENLITYYNFETSSTSTRTVSDIVGLNNGWTIGTVDFSNTDSFLKNAASFSKTGIVLTKLNMGDEGSIHFYFKIDSLPEEDMYLFGNEKGLKLKLCKDNLRLQIEKDEEIIVKSEDPKLSRIKIGEWVELGISWLNSEELDSSRINLYKDGVLEADEEFVPYQEDRYYAIGGLLTTEEVDENYSNVTYKGAFKGKIDDWRVYDVYKDLDAFVELDSNLRENGFEYCGIITLDKRFVKNNVVMDYYPFDNSLLKYDPYVPTYFSILEANNESIEEAISYATYCDLWPLYAINNGNLFEPDVLNETYVANEVNDGFLIKKGDKYVSRVNYPANINTVKYRFELTGQPNGIRSPIIENFVAIVSSSTIDFE